MKKNLSLPSSWNIKDCQDFAKYQSLLLVLMLVFVGILVLPSMMEKTDVIKKNGSVEKVWYNDGNMSIVDIRVGKNFHEKKIIEKPLNENDIVLVYVSKKNQISLQKPDGKSVQRFLLAYWVLLILSVGLAGAMWWNKV